MITSITSPCFLNPRASKVQRGQNNFSNFANRYCPSWTLPKTIGSSDIVRINGRAEKFGACGKGNMGEEKSQTVRFKAGTVMAGWNPLFAALKTAAAIFAGFAPGGRSV
jgi:hypothetical protein